MSALLYFIGIISLIELGIIIYLYISNWRKRVRIEVIENNIERIANERAKALSIETIEKARKEAVEKSKSVITGKVLEQMAPYLPGFNHDPRDARFIGSPIDYVVFDGLNTGEVKSIHFVEIKSGKSKLSSREESVKKAVERKEVYFETINLS